MKSPSHRSVRRSAGFTLIELLTVIAIIGILAAILIPTVSSVREKAKQAQCANNMRQWGMAINLYANDSKGKYYISRANGTVAWSQIGTNAAIYAPYFSRIMRTDANGSTSGDYGDLLLCPSEQVARSLMESGAHTPDFTCYAFARPSLNGAVVADPTVVPLSKATAPSRTLLMMERNFTTTGGVAMGTGNAYSKDDNLRSAYASFNRHGGRFNVVFMDGHTQRMSWDDGNANTSLAVPSANGRSTTLNRNWFEISQ